MPDTLADEAFAAASSGAAPAFFVVSVSGLTANTTYGETAQVGARLYASAHHFSNAAPTSVAWQWRDGTDDIAGATGAVYVPTASNNLTNIYPVATPLGSYAAQAGPAHTVRFAAPVASGGLPDVSYSKDTGNQTIAAVAVFAGEDLTFSVATSLPGVVIDSRTGVVTVPTTAEANGSLTVSAVNSGGMAQTSCNVSIATVATNPDKMEAAVVTTRDATSLSVDLAAAPEDGGSPITSYDLRLNMADADWAAGTTIRDVSDPEVLTGLQADTEYTVRTRAVNAIGRGPWSPVSRGRTAVQNDVAPTIAANADNTVDISVSDGTFSITVSGASQAHHNGTHGPFDTADLAGGPILAVAPVIRGTAGVGQTLTGAPGLWVYEADDAPAISTEWYRGATGTGDTDSSYTAGTVDGGATVTCVERAANAAGTVSGSSNGIAIPALAVPAQMSAPAVVSGGSGSISVDLAAAPGDGGSPITSYDLRWQDGAGAWSMRTGVSDPETISGLTADTAYTVQTRAMNGVGAGPWSASGSATTDAASGVLFSDDFTGYAPGANLVDVGPYMLMNGSWYNPVIADAAGTPVVEQDASDSYVRYSGYVLSGGDRRVTAKLHNLTDGPGNYMELLLSFTDSQNCTFAKVDPQGYLSLVRRNGGTTDIYWSSTAGTVSNGDTIELSLSKGDLVLSRNGTMARTVAGISPVILDQPGFRMRVAASSTTGPMQISHFEVEEK